MSEHLFVRPGRDVHCSTEDGGLSEKVLYSAAAPYEYRSFLVMCGFLSCNPCLISEAETLRSETYVTVYENKVETSNPWMCCCVSCDSINVMYLDSDEFLEMDKAGLCRPCFTHCRLCPTCFDACGEGLVLYGADACSGRHSFTSSILSPLSCVCPWKMLYPVRDAEEVKAVIVLARKKAFDSAKAHRSRTVPLTPHARNSFRLEDEAQQSRLQERNNTGQRRGNDDDRGSESGPRPENMHGGAGYPAVGGSGSKDRSFVTATPYAPAASDMHRH